MQTTARTIEYALAQTQTFIGRQAVATTAARLTRVGGVHADETAGGTCCLPRQQFAEPGPGRVTDAFAQTVIADHAVHREILNRDGALPVDNPAAMLMREVVPPEPDALMHTRHRLAVLAARAAPLLQLAMAATDFGQRLLFLPEEARVRNRCAVRESGERAETNVNTHGAIVRRQGGWFPRAGDRHIPLARAAALDRDGLGRALDRAVQHDGDGADLRELQLRAVQLRTVAVLRVGKAIV